MSIRETRRASCTTCTMPPPARLSMETKERLTWAIRARKYAAEKDMNAAKQLESDNNLQVAKPKSSLDSFLVYTETGLTLQALDAQFYIPFGPCADFSVGGFWSPLHPDHFVVTVG